MAQGIIWIRDFKAMLLVWDLSWHNIILSCTTVDKVKTIFVLQNL